MAQFRIMNEKRSPVNELYLQQDETRGVGLYVKDVNGDEWHILSVDSTGVSLDCGLPDDLFDNSSCDGEVVVCDSEGRALN